MRLHTILFLPVFVGAACASSEKAKVYIVPQPKHLLRSSTTPILSPQEARLVIAQRLGVSQYHSLSQTSSDALEYINVFGRQQSDLFGHDKGDRQQQLVLIVESTTESSAQRLLEVYGSTEPVFEISDPPSQASNAKLVQDISTQEQLVSPHPACHRNDDINPPRDACWSATTNILHLNAQKVSFFRQYNCQTC